MNAPALIEDFLTWKSANQGRSARTVEAYGHALRVMLEFFGDRDPLAATPEELVAFSGPWLHKRGVEALARRQYVTATREFFRWLWTTGRVTLNPANSLPYPRVGHKLPRVMSLQSAERLMWAPDFSTFIGVRDGAILAVLIGCGVRVGGLVGMTQRSIATAEIKGQPRIVIKTLEKGGRERQVPLPREGEMLLRVYLEHPELAAIDRTLPNGDQVLWVSVSNRSCPPHEYRGERRRLSKWAVQDLIRRYGRRVGIPEEQLHPHAMRHLYGTELAESQVDLLVRQELMGHRDPASTKIYEHLAVRRKVEEADRANPLGKMKTPVSDLLRQLAADKGRRP